MYFRSVLPWVITIHSLLLTTDARVITLNPLTPLRSISSALEYMLDHPEYLNLDSLFGITITEARLRNAEINLAQMSQPRPYTSLLLQQLIMYCEIIRSRASTFLRSNNENEEKITSSLLQPDLWISNIEIKDFNPARKLSWNADKIKHNIFLGSPNETSSDSCIGELLAGYDPGTVSRFEKCYISENCSELMTNGVAHGYPLTHRLLYAMISKKVGCSAEYDNRIGVDSGELCSRISAEAFAIFDAGIPRFARDLFVEQILLCGLEGYAEFLQVDFLRRLLSWQSGMGCWGAGTSNDVLRRRRYKRRSNSMPGGCVNHITGLATATLSLYADTIIAGALQQTS